MALGKNTKRDKLIPSEKKEKPVAKKKTVIKSSPEKKSASKSTVKTSAPSKADKSIKKTVSERKDEALESKLKNIKGVELKRVDKSAPGAKFITEEEYHERERLNTQFKQEIEGLKDSKMQIVVFKLEGEEYAFQIDQIKEVVATPKLSRIPHAPKYIKGLGNIRGTVMAIIDLSEKFGLMEEEAKTTQNSPYTLVIQSKKFRVGILVKEVPATLTIKGTDIDASTGIMSQTSLDETFIKGLVKQEEQMIILVDAIELIQSDEVQMITQAIDK